MTDTENRLSHLENTVGQMRAMLASHGYCFSDTPGTSAPEFDKLPIASQSIRDWRAAGSSNSEIRRLLAENLLLDEHTIDKLMEPDND